MLDFSQEARILLTAKSPRRLFARTFTRHEAVTQSVAILVFQLHPRGRNASSGSPVRTPHPGIEAPAGRLHRGRPGLRIVTVRIAARVFRQMEFQAGELSRVSFRLLETQESTARRFAHELHDELGGSLTAIRTNLTAIASRTPAPVSTIASSWLTNRFPTSASSPNFCAPPSSTISALTPASIGW